LAKKIELSLFLVFTLFSTFQSSLAAIASGDLAARGDLEVLLKKEISKNFSGARVQFTSPVQWVRGQLPDQVMTTTFLGTDGKGNAHFNITGIHLVDNAEVYAEAWVGFSAWIPGRVSVRRIHPGEPLRPEEFASQQIDISSGQAFEFRGVLLPEDVRVEKLEAVQSILEGQFLLSTAVRNIPDIRRGDSVRIHLKSGELLLTTLGIAEEPGYLKRQVRVMTTKNKREFLGELQAGGIVEVNL